jgi:hypothetical protein
MKNNILKYVFAVTILLSSSMLLAQNTQTGSCPTGTTTCSSSNQEVGNISPTSTATNSTSTAAQSNNSANANGAQVNPTINNNPQQEMSQGSATQSNQGGNTSGTVNGGNTASSADGNKSSNANQSSVGNTTTGPSISSVGPTSSNSGGNVSTTGPSTATSTANNGGNTTGDNKNSNTNQGGNTNSSNKNTAAGGAGGAGGQGGSATGGTATGGKSSANGTNTSTVSTASSNQNGSVTGGATTVDTGSHAVDSGNTSYNSKVLFIPSVVPDSAPSILGVGQIVVNAGHCGPLQQIVHHQVEGVTMGYFKQGKIDLGTTDEIVPMGQGHPAFDKVPREDGVEGYSLYGDQVVTYASVIGVAAAKNIALGGGGGGGSWGQGGAGQSSSMQRMVVTVQLIYCHYADVAIVKPAPVPTVTQVPMYSPVNTSDYIKTIPICATPKHIKE